MKLASLNKAAKRAAFKLAAWPVMSRLVMPALRRRRPIGSTKPVGDELFPSQGTPIVRAYWHHYLGKHAADIRGRALEIGTTATIRKFGGAAVTQADALDLIPHSPEVTLVANLMQADHLEGGIFDCFVNQFTTHILHDVPSSLYHSIRLLKPGGVLLVNFICVTGILDRGMNMGTGSTLHHYWWFTPLHVQHLLRGLGLEWDDFTIESYGNVFTRHAWNMNLPAEAVSTSEMEFQDPMFPIMLCVRVVRPEKWSPPRPVPLEPWYPRGMSA